jgi:hypothetical protein
MLAVEWLDPLLDQLTNRVVASGPGVGIVGVEALEPDSGAADATGGSGRDTIGEKGVPHALVGGVG